MIDRKTGTISFDQAGRLIVPRWSKHEFLSSPIGQESRTARRVGESETFSSLEVLAGRQLIFSFTFTETSLSSVQISFEDDASWLPWSVERENELKGRYDQLLKLELGEPPYFFAWGIAETGIDFKTGDAFAIIRYNSGGAT